MTATATRAASSPPVDEPPPPRTAVRKPHGRRAARVPGQTILSTALPTIVGSLGRMGPT
ncbi:hypothetical protein QJS66_21050 [Kocuria rhizophila]|nr:hypothetical protein QJS66_21050 [Kocuria rhizophila]